MATVTKRQNSDGSIVFRVNIRKKDVDISKTFYTEEDANLFIFYKERLLQNMANFEVSTKDCVTLEQIMDLKIKSIDQAEFRYLSDFNLSKQRLIQTLDNEKFLCDITYDDWIEAATKLYNMDIYRGGKTESCKRKMSLETLRKIFAYASASISYAIAQGIELQNHPLKVIQTFINPKRNQELKPLE